MLLATSKSGGGTQGREVKMKSVKKKYQKGRNKQDDIDDDDDDDFTEAKPKAESELQFLSIEEIQEELGKNKAFDECPEEFVADVAAKIYR